MEISSSSMHKFVFPFMGEGMVTFNVAANTQQDAAVMLKEWMNRAQLDLVLSFPEISPEKKSVSSEFNPMQISLLEDLATACKLDMVNLAKSIEEATGLPMTVANFKKIIPALETLRDATT